MGAHASPPKLVRLASKIEVFIQMIYHRLGPHDSSQARVLISLFDQVFEEPTRPLLSEEALLARLADDRVWVLVAMDHNKVVGGLVGYELPKFETQRSELYLYDLAVASAHQGQGIGRGLIDALITQVESTDIWAVFVQADLGDEVPNALYQSYGYEQEKVHHYDLWQRNSEREKTIQLKS